MSRLLRVLFLPALAFVVALPAQAGRPGLAAVRDPWLAIGDAVPQAIAEHAVPGAVVLVNDQGKTVYRKAFGSRSLAPASEPMTLETVFDLASLTKAEP